MSLNKNWYPDWQYEVTSFESLFYECTVAWAFHEAQAKHGLGPSTLHPRIMFHKKMVYIYIIDRYIYISKAIVLKITLFSFSLGAMMMGGGGICHLVASYFCKARRPTNCPGQTWAKAGYGVSVRPLSHGEGMCKNTMNLRLCGQVVRASPNLTIKPWLKVE